MELEWQEAKRIPDGKHTGRIVRVDYREEPYEYTDIVVRIDDIDIEIRYGCPTFLTEKSKLGRLLTVFGDKFEVGKKVDPNKILAGRKVEFMTLTKRNKDGKEYAEIVEDSIKPM